MSLSKTLSGSLHQCKLHIHLLCCDAMADPLYTRQFKNSSTAFVLLFDLLWYDHRKLWLISWWNTYQVVVWMEHVCTQLTLLNVRDKVCDMPWWTIWNHRSLVMFRLLCAEHMGSLWGHMMAPRLLAAPIKTNTPNVLDIHVIIYSSHKDVNIKMWKKAHTSARLWKYSRRRV